uniref:Uncharacterized protein n=1 Tax=Methylophaga nitratireducenticrescens TaxID=754476 RepID=I1XMA3_METNJ
MIVSIAEWLSMNNKTFKRLANFYTAVTLIQFYYVQPPNE